MLDLIISSLLEITLDHPLGRFLIFFKFRFDLHVLQEICLDQKAKALVPDEVLQYLLIHGCAQILDRF